jgi:pimeloyl-ACP methyl ester carboxylesterase
LQITINNISTHYTKAGEGEPVIILPGWSATSNVYNMLSVQLSEKYCVYSLDLAGFGITPEPPQPWSLDDYCDFVIAFVEALGLKSVTLIGHSFGGRIIIKLCNRELPFEIKKIALIDSAGIKNKLSGEQTAKQKKYKKLKKLFGKKPFTTLFPNAIEKLQKKYGSADYANATPLMRQTMVKAISEDLTPILSNVSVDTLLVWGKNDTATPYSDAVTMNNAIKNSKLEVIENAGHFPFIDQPFEFRNIIAKSFGVTV